MTIQNSINFPVVTHWLFPSSGVVMAPFFGYIVDLAYNMNLPSSSQVKVGDQFYCQAIGSGFSIFASAGQKIYFKDLNNVTLIQTTEIGASIVLRCFNFDGEDALFNVLATNGATFTAS